MRRQLRAQLLLRRHLLRQQHLLRSQHRHRQQHRQQHSKVFKVTANVGDAVKAGDTVIILESMKMEIPVVAPEDGTVASINVGAGDAVESGDLLATLN